MDADLQLARKGDRDAIARLVDQNYDAVYRFLARRVGAELAQDLAQETFLSAQKTIATFEGRSTLATWLFGIAHNHVRNSVRKRKAEPVDWIMNEPTENPESTLINRETLRKALKTLSEEHREVVLLHEIDGLTYEEAATVLGVPVGTVKSRLHHAFLALRRALLGAEAMA